MNFTKLEEIIKYYRDNLDKNIDADELFITTQIFKCIDNDTYYDLDNVMESYPRSLIWTYIKESYDNILEEIKNLDDGDDIYEMYYDNSDTEPYDYIRFMNAIKLAQKNNKDIHVTCYRKYIKQIFQEY